MDVETEGPQSEKTKIHSAKRWQNWCENGSPVLSLLKQKIFLFLWNKTYILSSDQWAQLIFNR